MPSQDISASSPAKKGINRAKSLFARFFGLFSKRDLIVIATFAVLGAGGAFAATLITISAPDSQGAGYLAATSCDEAVTIDKSVVFNATTKRFEVSTISISNVNQSYDATGRNGCGNQVLEMAFPINGSTTYASWTIPSSTITNGIFSFGGATGITYNAYTALTPVDAQSLATVALSIKPASRAVNNGPVYDVLKANGFTTTGQSGASSTITFALSLSCGVLTVDTTAPGVSTALAALAAPKGYETTTATSTGADGGTTAALLGYRGSVANINIILPWISYNKTAGTACTSLPVFQAAIWDAQSVLTPIAWNFSENGHYYQYVDTSRTWAAAYQDITGVSANYTSPDSPLPTARGAGACPYVVFGLCGYFATIQTPTENAFVNSKTGSAAAWLGGSDRQTNGGLKQFKWIDPIAPEYNKIFSTGTKAANRAGWGVGTTIGNSYTVNGTSYLYENWNGGEPNNSSPETVLQFLAGTSGLWNDLNENSGSLPYVIEYGGSTSANESPSGGGSKTSAITWNW